MKRTLLILVSGLALAVLAYAGVYHTRTASSCCIMESKNPELAWLKKEFHLSDAEFTRISELHEQYLAGCAERCRRIDEKNQELAALLAATNTVTPQIEKALVDTAELRADCQKKMLQHFYNVSHTMPPKQGKRYLDWVQSRTLALDTHQGMGH